MDVAFVCWNRFLDICESITEHEPLGESDELIGCGIAQDFPIPDHCVVSEVSKEQAREWILATSMEGKISYANAYKILKEACLLDNKDRELDLQGICVASGTYYRQHSLIL